MKDKTPFFINVMPSDDRREDVDYQKSVQKVVRESAGAGLHYTLMTVGDRRLDPWILAQMGMQQDTNFAPLIAVNPFYQHPVTVAKRLISLASCYDNRFALNVVSGSFFAELQSLGDTLDFEGRNRRLREFCEALDLLLSPQTTVHFKGEFFQFQDVQILPKWPRSHVLDIFVSGSVNDNIQVQHSTLWALRNFRPWEELPRAQSAHRGLGLGICARSTRDEAQKALQLLFPEDRKGQMLFAMSAGNAKTPWNISLQNHNRTFPRENALFSLQPLKNYWSSAPYLVGSYEDVVQSLKDYQSKGYEFFLLDFHQDDFAHIQECLRHFKGV